MKQTENYNFNLPGNTDAVDISVINSNFEKIDKTLADIKPCDQTYSPKSENPQSGVAVTQALSNSASAVSKTVEGTKNSPIQVNDVSEIPHELKIQINNNNNRLPARFFADSEELHGVTFTDNGDGTITVNGTATTESGSYAYLRIASLNLSPGEYELSGCAEGAEWNGDFSSSNYVLTAETPNYSVVATDSGDGATFTLTQTDTVNVWIRVFPGATINNGVFKPKLKWKVDIDDYSQFGVSIKGGDRTINVYPQKDGTISGVESIYPGFEISVVAVPLGISCTYNVDTQKYIDTTTEEKISSAVSITEEKERTTSNRLYTNALKGTASGEVISLNDVSPIKHNLDVKVRSKNIIPFPYYWGDKTINGITWTCASDGALIANGTAAENSNFTVVDTGCPLFITGKVATLSGCPTGGGENKFGMYYYDTTTAKYDYGEGVTFTAKGNVSIIVRVYKGQTVNNLVFKPQLELDSTATTYTPYIDDLTDVEIARCGKNLFDINSAVKISGASNFSKYDGAIYSTQASVATYTSANVELPTGLVGKTVTITADSETSGENTAAMRIQWCTKIGNAAGELLRGRADSDGKIRATGIVPQQPDETHNLLSLMFYSNEVGLLDSNDSNVSYTAKYFNIQLELGSSATAYEAYEAYEDATYTPKADGTVEEVVSLYPTTSLMTDTEGVIIDCEYNRDINKAFAALEAAIAAQNT